MKKLIVLAALWAVLQACSDSASDANSGTVDNGDQAPAFTLQSIDHGTVSLADYQGKVVVLFFLGYNCPICIGSGPSFQKNVVEHYSTSQVQALGLDVWDGSAGALANNFKIQTGATYPLLLMASAVGSAYGVRYDHIVIVDQQGTISYRKRGVNTGEIRAHVDNLLNE